MANFFMYALAIAIIVALIALFCMEIKPLYLDIKELLRHH